MLSRNLRAGLTALLPAVCLVLATVPSHAALHEIEVGSFYFSPIKTVVSPGDTVRWNFVSGLHTSTSEPTSPKQWDSNNLGSGSSFEVVFTAGDGPGPFPYLCSLHPTSMKDTIFMDLTVDLRITTELVAENLTNPVFVTSPQSDSTRLFVVEKPGLIRIIKDGSVLTRPFLDITALVNSSGNEQGLLGLAFHPQYPDSGYFYVNYTDLSGDTRIDRYSVTSDVDSADVASRKEILAVDQPFSYHNAGMLAFGPGDGYLYIGLGDGGSGGDPGNRAQNSQELLGKMLRIDINTSDPYAIPPDNPYVGEPDTLDEIWSFGLRNPWRYSFDRLAGDLYIADVGQTELEEIDFEPASSAGGVNYGWRLKEGTACYNPSTNCDPLGITTDPVYEYGHVSGRCSITGGYIYRGCALPDLDGYYFFGDFCTGEVFAFTYDGISMGPVQDVFNVGSLNLVSFGEDAFGELYIVKMSAGEILKIVPDGQLSQCPDLAGCCEGTTGNVDCSTIEDPDISDITRLIDFLYLSHNALCCPDEADVDISGGDPDISDITKLIDHLYLSHAALPSCP